MHYHHASLQVNPENTMKMKLKNISDMAGTCYLGVRGWGDFLKR